MKKIVLALSIAGCAVLATGSASADPAADLAAYQGFFKNRFPDVALEDYANGIYALDKGARSQWESIMELPPFENELEEGRKLWEKPFKNGQTFASCFKNGGVNIAQGYPYWNAEANEIRSLEKDLNACLKKNGEKEYEDKGVGPFARLTAYMKSLSRGQKVSLDLSSPAMAAAYERGKQFFWARRGQLHFSCANCHADISGKWLRGDSLSPGIGHGVGFPNYRARNGEIASLHHRYVGCNALVRAKPYKIGGPEYVALEVYESYMNTGLPLTAPSYRR